MNDINETWQTKENERLSYNERLEKIEFLEAKLASLQLSFPRDGWDLCAVHGQAYQVEEGCLKCEVEHLKKRIKELESVCQ